MISFVSVTFVTWLLILPLRRATFTYRVKTCTAYKATKSNNAVAKYCSCTFQLCPNQYVAVDSCGSCSGTQYLRLYGPENTQVAESSGLSSTCSPCSHISNFSPTNATSCQIYHLREGCATSGQCSASVKIFVANATISANVTSNPQRPPALSVLSIFSGEIENDNGDNDDPAEDWYVEEVPDIDAFDPQALEIATRRRYHSPSTVTQTGFEDGQPQWYTDVDADNDHSRLRRKVYMPSPTPSPTIFAASAGYCMAKKRSSMVTKVIYMLLPVFSGLLVIVYRLLQCYFRRNNDTRVVPEQQANPNPTERNPPPPSSPTTTTAAGHAPRTAPESTPSSAGIYQGHSTVVAHPIRPVLVEHTV